MAESRQRGSSQNGKQSGKRNGASPANRNAEKPDQALLRADSFTNAPKVSRSKLTKEEREEITKQQEPNARRPRSSTRSPPAVRLVRWWCKLQSSPDKVSLGMAIVALGVVYGDIGTSPLYNRANPSCPVRAAWPTPVVRRCWACCRWCSGRSR